MVTLISDKLEVQVAPEVGGHIVSFTDRATGYDFLWRNPRIPLRREAFATAYGPNSCGRIDELLPNEPEEAIEGLTCPDQGELWTSSFNVGQTTQTTLQMSAARETTYTYRGLSE